MMKKFRDFTYNPLTGELWKGEKLCVGTCSGGYIITSTEGEAIRAHKLIWWLMTGARSKSIVDHRNTNRLDNRWCNLREVTASQNGLNSNKTTAVSGVRGIKQRGKRFQARVMVNYRETAKTFSTLQEAIDRRRDELVRRSTEPTP